MNIFTAVPYTEKSVATVNHALRYTPLHPRHVLCQSVLRICGLSVWGFRTVSSRIRSRQPN
eukprot:5529970-Karenia_brevis.AAC.1